MMSFDPTVHIGDVIVAVIGLVLLPLTRLLVTTLMAMRESLRELQLIVVGTGKDPTSGLVGDIAELKKASQKHRNWLIEIQAEHGIRRDDRT